MLLPLLPREAFARSFIGSYPKREERRATTLLAMVNGALMSVP